MTLLLIVFSFGFVPKNIEDTSLIDSQLTDLI
jgi:hypothetical protein